MTVFARVVLSRICVAFQMCEEQLPVKLGVAHLSKHVNKLVSMPPDV